MHPCGVHLPFFQPRICHYTNRFQNMNAKCAAWDFAVTKFCCNLAAQTRNHGMWRPKGLNREPGENPGQSRCCKPAFPSSPFSYALRAVKRAKATGADNAPGRRIGNNAGKSEDLPHEKPSEPKLRLRGMRQPGNGKGAPPHRASRRAVTDAPCNVSPQR